MRLPNSLFSRTTITLMATSLLLVAITLASIAYFVLIPVGKQSGEDLAALLILSAQTWVELPPEARPDLEHELFNTHQLKLLSSSPLSPLSDPGYPYLSILNKAIDKRIGQPVSVGYLPDHKSWLWVDIPMAEELLRFGFPKERIGAHMPSALLTISVAVLILALITALTLALRMSKPLAALSEATTAIGRGETLLSLPETGPDELAVLARNFNKMSREVAELLENRTTLLAGVSHDLRTPLTRISLALELLPDIQDDELVAGLTDDVAAMDRLLNETLLLARGVEKHEALQELEISRVISEVVSTLPQDASQIDWEPDISLRWPIPLQVLKRILDNLLANAIRYGDGNPVTVRLTEVDAIAVIRILDRGPGIPDGMQAAVFRPFFRLENSRSMDTGGSGLGLAIVQQLCIAQGWVITLKPRTGGGTEACLRLG
jgi:two-component system osmolarity sensor histidine kinase EnvZ